MDYLRARGFDVLWIAEVSPGVGDADVLALGRAEARLTFGFDLDLAERIVRGSDAPPLGLVLFRGAPSSPTAPGEQLAALLDREDLELSGRITVVKGEQVRQRPFPRV
ncbi:MAG: hypothetical protein IT355_00810 [Gemmatimonadaceae bacterium]|nr:hypothetical protein [Gemmatimonadaceae bacterium]